MQYAIYNSSVLRQHHEVLWQNGGIVTKLWRCDTTGRPDRVTEQERSLAVSTRPRPCWCVDDSSQNVVVTSLSPWLWKYDCFTNNCCWAPEDMQFT